MELVRIWSGAVSTTLLAKEASLEYINVGRSGLKVSRICLGTNMFGEGYVDDDRALSVIDAALDSGINFIDTADMYNDGKSEELVGRAIKGKRDDLVIGTKGFAPMGPGVNDRGLSRKHVIDAVNSSLSRLKTDYIDLYQVHWWDPETPIEETLGTLNDLVRIGKIRYLGCSNFAAWQLAKALWTSDKLGLDKFVSIQLLYNMAQRGIEEEVFPLAEDQGVGVIPYQVLMGGLLTGSYDVTKEPPKDSHMASRHAGGAKTRFWNERTFKLVDEVKKAAVQLGYEPTQVSRAWCLSKSPITSVIVGSSRPEQITQNARSQEIRLPEETLERLNSL